MPPAAGGPAARRVRSPERTPLPQHYGFKPGTYMIGQFGTTAEARATFLPDENPGPGAYDAVTLSEVAHHCDSSWGTEPLSYRVPVRDRTPAPGAHGTEVPSEGGMLTQLLRRWPGRAESSVFGTNAERCFDQPQSEGPAGGEYDPVPATSFATNSLGGGRGGASPFAAEARRAVGSRKRISSDLKQSAAFASRSSRQPAAAGTASPGPTAYSPNGHFAAERRRLDREEALRRPACRPTAGGAGVGAGASAPSHTSRGFESSEQRFRLACIALYSLV